jgi:hypothetical protein
LANRDCGYARHVSSPAVAVDSIEEISWPRKKCRQTRLLTLPVFQSHDEDDKETIQVIIETPKGSRNKFAFDVDQKVFELKKVLPAGMTVPHDF